MPLLSASALLILFAGVLIAIQGPINATLGRAVGSSVNAAFISFVVGSLALGAVALSTRSAPNMPAMRALPWWAWLGGLCGAVFVSAAAYAAPRIGVATMLTIAIASQLLTAVALDHFGAFGVPQRTMSGGRVLGIVFVILGAVIMRRF